MKAEMTLDFNELYVFLHYVFSAIFEIEVDREQCEAIFHLMDSDGQTDIHYGELVMFTVAVKQIELRCEKDPQWAKRAFPEGIGRYVSDDGAKINTPDGKLFAHLDDATYRRQAWVRAVNQLDQETLSEVWAKVSKQARTNERTMNARTTVH